MTDKTAQWSLLPADPLGFFGLQPGFDRKQLKRAYGRLIRQYKPETHPQEFQRIREAYETLESQNRYGVEQARVAQLASAWQLGEPGRGSAQSGETTGAATVEAEVVSEVESALGDPKGTYQRLSRKEKRSPQDYFILATLSDLVDRESKNIYLKWLLTGLKIHPQDPGLLQLIAEFLGALADSKIALSTLLTLSKLVNGADFLRITEKLWTRLIDEVPFAQMAKALDACESNLHHRTLRPRLAFYIRLMRKAVWKAPKPWIEKRLKYIEQHGSELDSSLDEDLEFLVLIQEYIATDRDRVLAKPLGKSIDLLIESYCCASSMESITQVAAICDELARNGNGMMDTFPAITDEPTNRVLTICSIIASDVASDTGVDFGRQKQLRLEQQADAAVSDIRKTIDSVGASIGWMRLRHFGFPFLVLLLGPLILTFGWAYWGLFLVIWTLMAIGIFWGIAKPFYFEKRADEKTHKLLMKEYGLQWRPRLYRYVQASHVPANEAIQQLHQSASDVGQSQIIEIVLSYAFEDRSLHFFSRLQPFVN